VIEMAEKPETRIPTDAEINRLKAAGPGRTKGPGNDTSAIDAEVAKHAWLNGGSQSAGGI
jgi:hypothetical protein